MGRMESLLTVLLLLFLALLVLSAGLGIGIYFIVKAAGRRKRGSVPPEV
jgi:hypothetical protein